MRSNAWIPTIVLALTAVTLASAKSYDFTLDSAARAGSLQLAPGAYSLKLEGNTAILTSSDTGKRFTLPVTVKKVDKKFGYTAVETTKAEGPDHLNAIDLGGSNVQLDFSD
jgi:hypothetical protein